MQTANQDKHFSFLRSAFAFESPLKSNAQIKEWLVCQNSANLVNISKVKFSELEFWKYSNNSLRHNTGKFFSIDGIQIETNWGPINTWEQPIINQPEIGYLGFITKEFDGILHFLMQAKIEPGNVNHVQLAPTLQATRSNYTQVHHGKKPLYLDYFTNATHEQILLDQLQSEQGARFLKKRNRNIIIKIAEEIPVYDNFTWVTLGQLKNLMQEANLVNMDTRTVLSGIPYGSFDPLVIDFFNYLGYNSDTNNFEKAMLKSMLTNVGSLHTLDSITTFLTSLKSKYDLNIKQKPLAELMDWTFGDTEIHHKDNKYFKVIAVNVEIEGREVVKWTQPMIEPAQEGLCAFVCKEINGLLHFAVQAKLECGNHDIIEFAPTVQCLTGNYRQTKEGSLPFLDYVLNAKPEQVVFNTLQSEEGGRFFHEQNRNIIVIAGEEISDELPENYIWMTLNQLSTFLKLNNYLNIQARSLIAAISFVKHQCK